MHDEVSDTENIRKNLAIERMIAEGCDILLDVNQVFVRQGTLLLVMPNRPRMFNIIKQEREVVIQCFLFSNHLIITTRTQGGRLHLVEGVGKISLAEVTLAEDSSEETEENISLYSSQQSWCSLSDISNNSGGHVKQQDYHG